MTDRKDNEKRRAPRWSLDHLPLDHPDLPKWVRDYRIAKGETDD